MAFRLRGDEPVGKGLKRVVRKQLRSAVDRLTSDASDEAIHEARKSIKKVRALLQLAGDDVRAAGARKRLRRASHLLSPLRDADALIETARRLGRNGSSKLATAVATLVSKLEGEKTILADSSDRSRRKAARALDRVRRDARTWRGNATGFSRFRRAIKRSYKRARTGMHDTRKDNRPDLFHEWRKRMKTLWYALRFVERRAPQLRRPIADFKRLETALGDDHNLLVLDKRLASESAGVGWPGRARLRTLIERRQRDLRRQALSLGVRLFSHPPKAFAKRLERMWHAKAAAHRTATAA